MYRQPTDGSWQDMTAADISALRTAILGLRATNAPFDIAVGGRQRSSDWEQDRALIRSVAEAGATWCGEWVPAADLATMRTAISRGPLRI
jgi:hypothetical protein